MKNLNEIESSLCLLAENEVAEINGGDFSSGFQTGTEHGYALGKSIQGALTLLGIILFLLYRI